MMGHIHVKGPNLLRKYIMWTTCFPGSTQCPCFFCLQMENKNRRYRLFDCTYFYCEAERWCRSDNTIKGNRHIPRKVRIMDDHIWSTHTDVAAVDIIGLRTFFCYCLGYVEYLSPWYHSNKKTFNNAATAVYVVVSFAVQSVPKKSIRTFFHFIVSHPQLPTLFHR
ncbi:hypothetical protein BJV82DRAFT_172994 [Fennellomyces sp. T-0311]|nr:hypothetical protein BJV82DRAFT_172994 [Fennellomyces sp. T-0311]